MTITFGPASPESQMMLEALRAAVTKNLDRKRKLGEYVVVWQDGKPVLLGADAPTDEITNFSENISL